MQVLSGNNLNGTLPSMAGLTALVQLQINDNPWLTGSIPQVRSCACQLSVQQQPGCSRQAMRGMLQ